jgi:hypothetical protein
LSLEKKQIAEDREHLWKQPEFQRFLFEFYNAAAISRTTREEQHALFLEGKRSLGLEILGWFSAEAEPHDVISSVISSRIIFSKGTKRDDRNPDE